MIINLTPTMRVTRNAINTTCNFTKKHEKEIRITLVVLTFISINGLPLSIDLLEMIQSLFMEKAVEVPHWIIENAVEVPNWIK